MSVYCRALSFLYPYGATLNVMKPSSAVLSTGSVCFPLNRPVCAFYTSKVCSYQQIKMFFITTRAHRFTKPSACRQRMDSLNKLCPRAPSASLLNISIVHLNLVIMGLSNSPMLKLKSMKLCLKGCFCHIVYMRE